MRLILIVLAIAIAIGVLLRFGDSYVSEGVQFGDTVEAFAYGALALAITASALLHYRGKLSTAFLAGLAWIAIFGAVIVGYTYRAELTVVANRVMDEVIPGRQVSAPPGQAVFVRSRNGHFRMNGITNGKPISYMFDTGASSVVLTAEDARKIGFTPDKLRYTVPVSTANGRALSARVRLDALTIGNITLRDVSALVARPGALRENLLGMSFLGRLTRYSVEKNRLVLQQ